MFTDRNVSKAVTPSSKPEHPFTQAFLNISVAVSLFWGGNCRLEQIQKHNQVIVIYFHYIFSFDTLFECLEGRWMLQTHARMSKLVMTPHFVHVKTLLIWYIFQLCNKMILWVFCAFGPTLKPASSYCPSNSSLPLAVQRLSNWMWQGFISSFKNKPADASGSELAGLTFTKSFQSTECTPRETYRSRRSRRQFVCLFISPHPTTQRVMR